jgi:hypothetical protein
VCSFEERVFICTNSANHGKFVVESFVKMLTKAWCKRTYKFEEEFQNSGSALDRHKI